MADLQCLLGPQGLSPWKPLVITPRKAVRDLGGFAGEVPQGDSFRMVRRGGCRCDRDHPSPGSDLDRTCTGGGHPRPRTLGDPCRALTALPGFCFAIAGATAVTLSN